MNTEQLRVHYGDPGRSMHGCENSLRVFANNLLRALVLSQPKENRLAQMPVFGPFGEPHLADQTWFKPRAAPHLSCAQTIARILALGRQINERTIRSDDFLEFLVQLFQQAL